MIRVVFNWTKAQCIAFILAFSSLYSFVSNRLLGAVGVNVTQKLTSFRVELKTHSTHFDVVEDVLALVEDLVL